MTVRDTTETSELKEIIDPWLEANELSKAKYPHEEQKPLVYHPVGVANLKREAFIEGYIAAVRKNGK